MLLGLPFARASCPAICSIAFACALLNSLSCELQTKLEKLKKRGGELLDRLPGALSSELMHIVAQSETVLAKSLQSLLVDTLMDVTKIQAQHEQSSPGDTDSEGAASGVESETPETMLRDLNKMAGDVFDRLPSEHSEGLLQGVLQGNAELASLCKRSSDTAEDDMGDWLVDLVTSAGSLFDILPADLADEIIASIMQGSTPLAVCLLDSALGSEPASRIAQDPSEGGNDIEHVAVVGELLWKVMNSIEERLATNSPSLMLGDGEVIKSAASEGAVRDARYLKDDFAKLDAAKNSRITFDLERGVESGESSDVGAASEGVSSEGEGAEGDSPKTRISVKIDGNAGPTTTRTPLSSIPEDAPVSIAAWTASTSSVPQSLNNISAVLKFNNIDVATGYAVFDLDQDGRVSLRDLRKKSQELALEMSDEAVVELFQTLVDARTGFISREVWEECLASGDADSVLNQRGVADMADMHLLHTVQDVMDDIIDFLVREMEPPKAKDPKKTRGVPFAEDVDVQRQDTAHSQVYAQTPLKLHFLHEADQQDNSNIETASSYPSFSAAPGVMGVNRQPPVTVTVSPGHRIRTTSSHYPIRMVKSPSSVLVVESGPNAVQSAAQYDDIRAEIVIDEEVPRTAYAPSAPDVAAKIVSDLSIKYMLFMSWPRIHRYERN